MLEDNKTVIRVETVFDSSELLKALGDIGKIGGNLNQIAHHLNGGQPMSEEMKKEIYRSITVIKEIRDNIRRIVGEYRGGTKAHKNKKQSL